MWIITIANRNGFDRDSAFRLPFQASFDATPLNPAAKTLLPI